MPEDKQPENVSVITDETISAPVVPDDQLVPEVDFPLLTPAEAMVLGGQKVGGLIDLIGGLLKAGWIVDALNLLRLLSNDATTVGQLKAAVAELIAKYKQFPTPPKMMAGPRPTREDVLAYLKGKGVDTNLMKSTMLGLLICLAIRYGLPILEKIIEQMLKR